MPGRDAVRLEPQDLPLGTADAIVLFEVGAASLMSVTAKQKGAAWGTAVLTAKWANDKAGPFVAFASGEYSGSAATIGAGGGGISWLNVQGKGYLVVQVTTAEGAAEGAEITAANDL